MRDLYEQLLSFFWITIHHRWAAAFTAALICLIGWAIVYKLPDQYEVSASIYFEDETLLTPVLKGIATDDYSGDERAMMVRRTITNATSLLQIAQSSGVDTSKLSDLEIDDLLTEMFKNITIENKRLSTTNRKSSQNLYTIDFIADDPEYAYAVVNSIIDLFIDKFIRTGDKESEKIEGFLQENIADYKTKLEQAEGRLKQFKQKHPNLTQQPGQGFFTQLNQTKTDLEDAKLALLEEKNRNFTLRTQLNNIIAENRNSTGAAIKAQGLSLIEQRIQDVEQKLAELKLQFTDKHPDVQSNERILKQLLEQKAQEDKNPVTATSANSAALVSSPLYQQLQLAVSDSNSKVSALTARISQYESKLAQMNTQITVMPEIESELLQLTRDYNGIKDKYDSLVQRNLSSELSRQAERASQEMLYQILDEPAMPIEPSFPNRKYLSALVLIMGFAGAVALAWFLEQFNPKVYREKQIEDELGLSVYGNVPMYWSTTEVAARRFGAMMYSLFILGIFASFMGLLFHYGFRIEPYIEMLQSAVGLKSL